VLIISVNVFLVYSCGQENSFVLSSDEYITALSGRCGGTQHYRIDVDAGNQAVGFVGRSGRYLNAIGLNFVPLMIPQAGQTIVVGGAGGAAFSDPGIPRGAKISEVQVRSGDRINAIQMVFKLLDGRILEGQVQGGEGGTPGVFQLDPDEYLVGLSGSSGVHIHSISIRTNRRTSQVFGESSGGNIFLSMFREETKI